MAAPIAKYRATWFVRKTGQLVGNRNWTASGILHLVKVSQFTDYWQHELFNLLDQCIFLISGRCLAIVVQLEGALCGRSLPGGEWRLSTI